MGELDTVGADVIDFLTIRALRLNLLAVGKVVDLLTQELPEQTTHIDSHF